MKNLQDISPSDSNVDLVLAEHLAAIEGGIDTYTNTKSHIFLEQTDNAAMMVETRGGTTTSTASSEDLETIARRQGNARLKMLLGVYPRRVEGVSQTNEVNPEKSAYSQERYQFFLDAPFEISNQCCNIMKKNPAHSYCKQTGRNQITAQMASESRLRTQKWIEHGCNGFDLAIPTSNPMSFWTEQDVLMYIYTRKLPICSLYGDIVDANGGQMTLADIFDDMELFDIKRPVLKTTGCERTGCALCGFGAHLCKKGEKGRYELLKETHPEFYKLLDIAKNNGVTMREAIEWTNEHGNLNIKL